MRFFFAFVQLSFAKSCFYDYQDCQHFVQIHITYKALNQGKNSKLQNTPLHTDNRTGRTANPAPARGPCPGLTHLLLQFFLKVSSSSMKQ